MKIPFTKSDKKLDDAPEHVREISEEQRKAQVELDRHTFLSIDTTVGRGLFFYRYAEDPGNSEEGFIEFPVPVPNVETYKTVFMYVGWYQNSNALRVLTERKAAETILKKTEITDEEFEKVKADGKIDVPQELIDSMRIQCARLACWMCCYQDSMDERVNLEKIFNGEMLPAVKVEDDLIKYYGDEYGLYVLQYIPAAVDELIKYLLGKKKAKVRAGSSMTSMTSTR